MSLGAKPEVNAVAYVDRSNKVCLAGESRMLMEGPNVHAMQFQSLWYCYCCCVDAYPYAMKINDAVKS